MKVRGSWLALLSLAGCAAGGTSPPPPGLQGAIANYPPLIINGNVHPTDGSDRPLSCAAPGSRVEQKGGPTLQFGGRDASDPDLCLMTIEGGTVKAWYDIWLTDWPGATQARPLLRDVINGPSGTVRGFDNDVAPGNHYHDLMRNEGVEDIWLLNRAYHALKISHYREGFDGNDYRSVSTVWKDIPTGMLIYGTYYHISGRPELDDPLIPTAIVAK